MDFHCPSRPPAERRAVRAYLLNADEEEHMTDFDYDTKGLTGKKTEPESKLEDVKDKYEPSGNGQRRRTRVNAEKDK